MFAASLSASRRRPSAALILAAALASSLFPLSTSCSKAGSASAAPRSVAVFVPGVVAGSPLYEQMVSGAKKAADEAGVPFKSFEAGFNQADWQSKLTELAAQGGWGLIVTSNPAMPALAAETLKSVPSQRFLILDGYLKDNDHIATAQYNQVEQGYLAGYLAGLVTTSSLPGANPEPRVGLIAAQSYSSLDQAIVPGFRKGLEAAAPGAILDERMVGNWYDAQRALELAKAIYASGADIILPIAGGAGQGVLTAAQSGGKYVVWFDASQYSLAQGTILGCSVLRQERAVYERVKAALQGKLAYGKPEILSAAEGYVDFDEADPLYQKYVPAALRERMKAAADDLRSGKLKLDTPTF